MELDRTKVIKFKGKDYPITFPTVGQFIDMETEKLKYSSGQWGNLIGSGTLSGLRAIQIVECIAFFVVICPEFIKDLNVEDIKDIDAIDFADLLKVYKKDVSPWYTSWFKAFNDVITEGEEEIK